MQYREYFHHLAFVNEVDGIGEPLQQYAPRLPMLDCIRCGEIDRPLQRGVQLKNEFNAKTRLLGLIPPCRSLGFNGGFRPDT